MAKALVLHTSGLRRLLINGAPHFCDIAGQAETSSGGPQPGYPQSLGQPHQQPGSGGAGAAAQPAGPSNGGVPTARNAEPPYQYGAQLQSTSAAGYARPPVQQVRRMRRSIMLAETVHS